MKTCNKCFIEKSDDCFRVRLFKVNTCKDCEKLSSKNNYNQNKEKYANNSKKWKSENKEKIRDYKKKVYWSNPDKEREYKRNQYKNPLMFIKNALRWAKENPEKKAEQNRKRRVLKNGNGGGGVTKEQWIEIKVYYKNTCLKCKKQEPEIKLTLDHVIPISRGGEHDVKNIQPLCLSCNSSKKDKTIDYRR
jgi:5-methylcytosine-specific restriction endonuclease McrA